MKKLFFTSVLSVVISSTQAQFTQKDSVTIQTEIKIQNLEYNLGVFQQRRQTSNILLVSGIVFNIFGLVSLNNEEGSISNDINGFGIGCLSVGSGLLASRWILTLDNLKWITTNKRQKGQNKTKYQSNWNIQ